MDKIKYSLVIPMCNEEESIQPLYAKIKPVMERLALPFEVIFIDDGSRDLTLQNLIDLANRDSRIKVIKFRKNFGQTAAWSAGFREAQGDIVVAMDGDLQNDPEDIPRLIAKIDEGFDVVSGWRADRHDPFGKRIASRLANALRKWMTKETIHDSGCALKAYRREALEGLELYGEMHRFITALLMWKGFKVGEIKVKHHSRKFGKTKYSGKRLLKGLLDLIVVKFWMQYSTRPIHIFGTLGFLLSFLGLALAAYLFIIRVFFHISLVNKTSPLLAILLVVLGVQFIVSGILADIAAKIYFSDRKTYSIEKIIRKT